LLEQIRTHPVKQDDHPDDGDDWQEKNLPKNFPKVRRINGGNRKILIGICFLELIGICFFDAARFRENCFCAWFFEADFWPLSAGWQALFEVFARFGWRLQVGVARRCFTGGLAAAFTLVAEAREFRETQALDKMTPEEREKYHLRQNGEESLED